MAHMATLTTEEKTAANIYNLSLQNEWPEDDYHALALTGAQTLCRAGCGDFRYRTGWRSSTLWADAADTNTLVVNADGRINH